MPLYEYRATDKEGRPATGTIEDASPRRVTATLEERGLLVSSVTRIDRPKGIVRLRQRLTWEDLDIFNEQLHAIAKSGLPMAESMKALARDMRNPRLRPVLEDMHRRIEQGSSLEEAIEPHRDKFPPTYLSVIRAGERSGNLAGVLANLSEESARMTELKSSMQEAAAYPVLVLVAACAIVLFLFTEVVPEYQCIFGDFGASLPWLTRVVLGIRELIMRRWPWLMVGACMAVIALRYLFEYLRSSGPGGLLMDSVRLRLGGIGRMYYSMSLSRFCQCLRLLLASDVPIVEGLDLASASAGSPLLREAVKKATLRVQGGETLSQALSDTKHFDNTFCWLLATAEERGDLDDTLGHLGAMYDRAACRLSRLFLALFTPVVVVLIGFVIGLVVMAMYLPLFTLTDIMGC